MQNERLAATASEDIDDALRQIETSFAIKFGPVELQHVRTFGELCAIIENKIRLLDTVGCTSQQAFYKLRTAFEISTGPTSTSPATSLATLLPKRKRKIIWRSVEHQLGFKLKIIGISSTVMTIIFLAYLSSFAAFFSSASAGGIGLAVSTLFTLAANKTGNALQLSTMRELVEKMTREQYAKSRRNSGTYNRKEVFKQVQAIFIDSLALPASALGREASFV